MTHYGIVLKPTGGNSEHSTVDGDFDQHISVAGVEMFVCWMQYRFVVIVVGFCNIRSLCTAFFMGFLLIFLPGASEAIPNLMDEIDPCQMTTKPTTL